MICESFHEALHRVIRSLFRHLVIVQTFCKMFDCSGDIQASTVIVKTILSPASIPSARRTCALSGRRYVLERLSGKIEVSHFVFPRVTEIGIEPNPLFPFPYFSLSSADCFLSTFTKCHAPACPERVEWTIPGYNQTSARTSYFFLATMCSSSHAPSSFKKRAGPKWARAFQNITHPSTPRQK